MALYDDSVLLLTDADESGAEQPVYAGRWCYMAEGTFNGATLTLEIKGPGGGWISTGADAELAEAGAVEVVLPNCAVRVGVSGGTPSGLNASLSRIGS